MWVYSSKITLNLLVLDVLIKPQDEVNGEGSLPVVMPRVTRVTCGEAHSPEWVFALYVLRTCITGTQNTICHGFKFSRRSVMLTSQASYVAWNRSKQREEEASGTSSRFSPNQQSWATGMEFQLQFRALGFRSASFPREGREFGETLFSYSNPLGALCKLCSSIQLGYSCCNIKGNFCKKACAHDFPLDTGSPAGILLPCKPVPKIPAGNFPTNSTWDPYNYVTCCQKPQQN